MNVRMLNFPAGCFSLDGFLLKNSLPGVTSSWQGISSIPTTPCFGTLNRINGWSIKCLFLQFKLHFLSLPSPNILMQGLLMPSIPLVIPVVIELECAQKSHGWLAVSVDLWMPSSDIQISRSWGAPRICMVNKHPWWFQCKLRNTGLCHILKTGMYIVPNEIATSLPIPWCYVADYLLANKLTMEYSVELCWSKMVGKVLSASYFPRF